MTYNIQPVILCGGAGTRLWPLSTPQRPKQFLDLVSEKSMIAETASRFDTSLAAGVSFANMLVIGSEKHAHLLEQALPSCRKILEPFGRNSAPAVAAACLASDTDALALILPADHDITDVASFHRALEAAAPAATEGTIVTFGIEPTTPATGYGYIKAGSAETGVVLPVESFVEKPNLKTAGSYLAEGSYLWNAGIFLFKVRTMMDALTRFAPEILDSVRIAMQGEDDREVVHLNAKAFAEAPSISIDYAVMEKAKNVKTVPVSMGWSDVGGYRALHGLLTQSATENLTTGAVVVKNSHGLFVRSEGPVIAVNGVSDLVIVATQNEVMITPMQDDSAVKNLGAVVQRERYALGLTPELRDRVKNWLWATLETWSQVGWDSDRSGFVEQLRLDGTSDTNANRRVRVQARQVYSFAKAIELGWPNAERAETLVTSGLKYIDTHLRHPDGGFVHLIKPDGNVLDARRDLYDHAFMILAGSAAYRAVRSELGLKIAEDAIAYINSNLKDGIHGGWFESSELQLPRRANPHMHLLEAMMEFHAATGLESALDHAAESVGLFESKFFDPTTNLMAEFFDERWAPNSSAEDLIFEPGHLFEWASLLCQYDQMTGHDSLSWRRRLIHSANEICYQTQAGFAANALYADGRFRDHNSRLWPQLEGFRAMLLHPSTTPKGQCERHLKSIFKHFLSRGPKGGWMDELSPQKEPISSAVPASMLYHLITAFAPVIPD